MRSFRQKIVISCLIVLGIFFALMFPFITNSVHRIISQSMNDRADEIIAKLQKAPSKDALISILKNEKHLLFYRIGLIDKEHTLLYDSHTKNFHTRLKEEEATPAKANHTEVEEAFQTGTGYAEAYSQALEQKLIYVAKKFEFQKSPYVLRLAFPYQYIQELRERFIFGFFFYGGLVLLLFFFSTTILLYHFSSPIRDIIRAISKYREGKPETLPLIHLHAHPRDEFTLLAKTVTSLSRLVRKEIETITLERNEREAILEAIQAGVLVLDTNNQPLYMNSTAKRMCHTTQELPSVLTLDIQALIERAHRTQKTLVQDLQVEREGETAYLHILAIPKENGDGTILVLHDRSQEYRILEMRKAFIANASHELKTPITIIRGFAETLFDHPELPQKTIKEVTEKIVDSCHKMTGLIANLLLLSDIEHLPSYRLVEIDCIRLLRTCLESIQIAYPALKVTLEYNEEPIECWGAQELLEMAFTNLLDNAAKYSHHNPECTVHIRKVQETIQIEIIDKGIGISEENQRLLFQRFFRGDQRGSKKFKGYGLGLSIVDTIIKKHKGSIQVHSQLGKGTSITVTLPGNLKELLEA